MRFSGFFIFLQKFFGAFQGIFPAADKIMDQLEIFYINRAKKTVAFAIFFGL